MEIKTTNRILEIEYNISPDVSIMGDKEFIEYSKKHNIFCNKEWISLEDYNKIIEMISFAMELRSRGYEIDITTQSDKAFFRGGRSALLEFKSKLCDIKYIESYIQQKGKYMSDEEKKKWIKN